MQTKPVAGVILAAGPSRRFGDQPPKQLLEIEGEPLVRRIVGRAAASQLASLILVVGFQAAKVRDSVGDAAITVVENARYADGQSGSVRAGLQAVDARAVGAMFIPVDQPEITTALIDALLNRYWKTEGRIVVPVYRGRRGAPVIFDRSLFGELEGIDGDEGGRQLFAQHEQEIVELPLSSSRPLQDIDSRTDLGRYGSY